MESGPRGGSGDRHGQAGGGVREHPRGVRDRARRQSEAARLPHAQPRCRLRRERSDAPEPEAGAGARARARSRRPRRRCEPVVAVAAGGVEERVLAIVAEQTGYPTDLLDMESGPRGGSGDRHGQAGGGVREHPRGLRDRARRRSRSCAITPRSTMLSPSSRALRRRPSPKRRPSPRLRRPKRHPRPPRRRRLSAARADSRGPAAARLLRAHGRRARRRHTRRAHARPTWHRCVAGRAPRQAGSRGAGDPGHSDGRGARGPDRDLASAWADRRRLLARGPRPGG